MCPLREYVVCLCLVLLLYVVVVFFYCFDNFIPGISHLTAHNLSFEYQFLCALSCCLDDSVVFHLDFLPFVSDSPVHKSSMSYGNPVHCTFLESCVCECCVYILSCLSIPGILSMESLFSHLQIADQRRAYLKCATHGFHKIRPNFEIEPKSKR